jgi:ABC-2 type transport system ATP-binding protein
LIKLTTNVNIISAQGVTKKFGKFTAVNHISFDVKKGELFAFLGPNGAGKSTTIKMLTTLLKPSSGSLILNDFDVVKNQDSVRKSFGIVFQDPSLDNELTGYENMELHAVFYGLSRREIRPRIESLLELVELWNHRDRPVKYYSGGMKRRLEVARALLHHPHVLFLDEPTLGLDAQTRSLFWNYIKQMNHDESMTVFFTTHYIEEAEAVAERIAMIDHGKIVALGSSKELMDHTSTTSLEEAYLTITGHTVRDEQVSASEVWKERRRARNMR